MEWPPPQDGSLSQADFLNQDKNYLKGFKVVFRAYLYGYIRNKELYAKFKKFGSYAVNSMVNAMN